MKLFQKSHRAHREKTPFQPTQVSDALCRLINEDAFHGIVRAAANDRNGSNTSTNNTIIIVIITKAPPPRTRRCI